MQEKLFALDIGTRSVVGIILEKNEENYCVIDITSIEHTERAMLDGQIHDVLAVSKIITDIKKQLEEKHGPLKKVSVAAAGRALKTERALVSVNIQGKPMMNREDILHLELNAVQQAQALVAEKGDSENNFDYYCVGYSILYYRLDGVEIGSLIDQNGKEASVEIIATFLPKVVVESLMSALKRADLEMQALTLEPIAAINVLIPASMRRLNVALVDIGAGTSDIAITDKSTVIAYGMVPIAGDEITEAISDALLLDFPLAEQAKRQISQQESITVKDILGHEEVVATTDIVQKIYPALIKLAESISDEILELNNNTAPKAIMLVGGGSLTPELPKMLSEKLNLPLNRIAVRGIEAIQHLTFNEQVSRGPELVTPIGIAIAAQQNPIEYITVSVNQVNVRLFNMKQLTIADCLLSSGMRANKLYGKPGIASLVSVNGQTITIPGVHGQPPTILLNGQPASLDATISTGDRITVEKGKDGTSPEVKIKDLLDNIPRKNVTINDTNYVIEAVIKKNGVIVSGEEKVEDHDEIYCKLPENIEALLQSLGLQQLIHQAQLFTIFVNGKAQKLPAFSGKIKKNNLDSTLSASFENNDHIQIDSAFPPTLKAVADELDLPLKQIIPVTFNGNRIILQKKINEVYRNEQLLKEYDTIHSGDKLTTTENPIQPFVFQDVFRHVDLELPKVKNARFILIRNNKESGFHDPIHSEDDLRIVWPAIGKENQHKM